MIHITDKSQCCGCSACVQACPKQCIHLQVDKEGFLYPYVEQTLCVDCGICENVCPVINQNETRKPLRVYAAKHPDDEARLKSSSGGVFTFLAEQIINDGGVVFGARFDEAWQVVHDYTETIEGLAAFRGSKYSQSVIGDSYKLARQFLRQGREVMFTGTPCQVAGLNKFLRKEYENLLTVDFVCHGVPSPLVWRRYLDEQVYSISAQQKGYTPLLTPNVAAVVTGVSFRDKTHSWKRYDFKLSYKTFQNEGEPGSAKVVNEENSISEPYVDNAFMRAFLGDYILRPSCYACPSKQGKSGSDITIGDLWGVDRFNPSIDDDRGLSLVLIHNDKVRNMLACCNIVEVDCTDALNCNPSVNMPVNTPVYRRYFWHQFHHGRTVADILTMCQSPKILARLRRLIFRKLNM